MQEIKKYYQELVDGTKVMFKEFFNRNTMKSQIANMLTFSRLIIAPIVLIFMIIGLPIPAVITAALGALTDAVDGFVARKTNSVSKYGQLLDPVLDKYFNMLLGIGLAVVNPLFLINILGETIISITNIVYQIKHKDIKVKSSSIGKIKQWPLALTLALGLLSTIFPALSIATNVSILFTAVLQSAVLASYIIENNSEIKKASILKMLENHLKNDDEKSFENEKELEKTSSIEKQDKKSKKEQYINLRSILLEVKEEQERNLEKTETHEKNPTKVNIINANKK